MSKFRKKPVVIEAMQFTLPLTSEFLDWIGFTPHITVPHDPDSNAEMLIPTLEDGSAVQVKHVATEGDWIIRGVQGELYPCKPDIFAATYEPA